MYAAIRRMVLFIIVITVAVAVAVATIAIVVVVAVGLGRSELRIYGAGPGGRRRNRKGPPLAVAIEDELRTIDRYNPPALQNRIRFHTNDTPCRVPHQRRRYGPGNGGSEHLEATQIPGGLRLKNYGCPIGSEDRLG